MRLDRILITLAFIFVLWGLFAPVKASEVEMSLKVSNGVTVREYYISDHEGTFMQCVFQAPIIATRFINENLAGQWLILRMTCGPPRRNM